MGGLGESVSNVCPTSFDEIDPTQAFCTRIPQLVSWWGGVGHETSWSNYFFRSVDKFFQGVNKLALWQVVMTERPITKKATKNLTNLLLTDGAGNLWWTQYRSGVGRLEDVY